MEDHSNTRSKGCQGCMTGASSPDFTMAFQPIVDVEKGEIYAFEALVRPIGGGGAHEVLSRVTDQNRYTFDQACRVKAITLAAELRMQALLSINFLPNAVYQPAACIQTTLKAAASTHFPLHHVIFEVTEAEPSRDPEHLAAI